MVAGKVHIDQEMKAKLFAFALASLAMTGAAVGLLPAEAVVPLVTFLGVAASAGLVLAWRRAEEALSAARQAQEDLALVSERLAKIEALLQTPAAAVTPALRTTMAEVTGTVGLLGGVVRELAKNVAAQNRDVAELKGSLKAAPQAEQSKVAPVLLPQTAPATARASTPQPARRTGEDELRRMRLITQAFEADSIELHLQPIVGLPQRKIRFYEALARLRLTDGTLLGPSEFLNVLERLGRAPEFDRRVLNRAMTVAYHLLSKGSEAIVGVNLTPHSFREPGFLWSLTGLLDATPETLGKVVLEFPQECWSDLDEEQKGALRALSGKGVALSLDKVADLRFDARELADLGVRFVKLPAELIVAAEQDERQRLSVELGIRDFASALRREGIKLVAEHVEREEMVPVLADLGVPLAQGFVFAAPRAVKAEVVGPPPQAASESVRPLLRRYG